MCRVQGSLDPLPPQAGGLGEGESPEEAGKATVEDGQGGEDLRPQETTQDRSGGLRSSWGDAERRQGESAGTK